ncbi:MAG: hypothetical protein V1858_05040 [Candidatus Gottesmanbacteria bacterium]
MSELNPEYEDQLIENKRLASWEREQMMENYLPYNFYGRSYGDYENSIGLSTGLIGTFIDGLPSERRFALDVGADTSALRKVNIAGVAIGLFDPRSYQRRNLVDDDLKANRHMIVADVLSSLTWIELESKMQKFGFAEGFPLVTMVPECGLRQLTQNPRIHFDLLNRLWSVLNPLQGLMVVELEEKAVLSPSDNSNLFKLPIFEIIKQNKWNSVLKEHGIDGQLVKGGFILERSRQSPDTLPSIPNLTR